jgi:predicted TIM-barrel fold metal-dependent hydrolase
MSHNVIDCLVNVHFGETEHQPGFMLKVRDDYFKGPSSLYEQIELPALLDEMDANGVSKAILMDNIAKPSTTAREFVAQRPDRFALAMGGVNLLRPVASLRELTALAADLPVAYAVVGPSFWGDGQYPPSDAVYYPLYAKCAEIDLPLCVNTGIPGPPIPGEVQNPIHLDGVCVRFPELRLCMIHGADPWWDTAIRMLIKYENLRLMTSAWSPKRLPESLLHYMRTRGPNKVIFASDYPVLRQHRVVPEATALDLPPEVLQKFLHDNADEFFFAARTTTAPARAAAVEVG